MFRHAPDWPFGIAAVMLCGQFTPQTPDRRSVKRTRRTHTMAVNAPLNRKLRMGLVGGGQGSFIGRVHSIAACLDNRATVVAGALSADPAKAKASAPDYDIPSDRAYGSYQEMIAAEA